MIPRLEANIILNCRKISPLGTVQLLKSFTQRNMIDSLITVQKHCLLKVLILQLDYSTSMCSVLLVLLLRLPIMFILYKLLLYNLNVLYLKLIWIFSTRCWKCLMSCIVLGSDVISGHNSVIQASNMGTLCHILSLCSLFFCNFTNSAKLACYGFYLPSSLKCKSDYELQFFFWS